MQMAIVQARQNSVVRGIHNVSALTARVFVDDFYRRNRDDLATLDEQRAGVEHPSSGITRKWEHNPVANQCPAADAGHDCCGAQHTPDREALAVLARLARFRWDAFSSGPLARQLTRH